MCRGGGGGGVGVGVGGGGGGGGGVNLYFNMGMLSLLWRISDWGTFVAVQVQVMTVRE